MPRDFDKCVAAGGKVRTESGPCKEHGLEANQYVKYCILGGKSFRGHVVTKSKAAARAAYKERLAKVKG